jgi:hypothetical protein
MSAVSGAWRSLISTSRRPPGASQTGAACAARVDVDRVNLPDLGRCRDGGRYRTRAGAQVNNNVSGSGHRNNLLHKEFGAPPGHKDPGLYRDAQSAELGPADDVLDR